MTSPTKAELAAVGTTAATPTAAQLVALATASPDVVYRWILHHHRSYDFDPYARAQGAARQWLKYYGGPPDTEEAVRAWAMVRWNGHKGLAGATARGWREWRAGSWANWTMDWVPDEERSATLMCPYRYSQHGGASKGGGTWSAQWRKAWESGVRFAEQLAEAQ